MRPHFSRQRVHGTPFQVHGRTFVPEAQVTVFSGRAAVIGADHIAVRGFHARHVHPTALIELTSHGERRYHIDNTAAQVLLRMALAVLLIPILSIMLGRRLGAR
jgi:hypothetical protein